MMSASFVIVTVTAQQCGYDRLKAATRPVENSNTTGRIGLFDRSCCYMLAGDLFRGTAGALTLAPEEVLRRVASIVHDNLLEDDAGRERR